MRKPGDNRGAIRRAGEGAATCLESGRTPAS
jgi:hypothetical protein